ncbi:MAG: hypothetical protein ABIB11_02005, partial [Candidatus Omnitrophota bacterium]
MRDKGELSGFVENLFKGLNKNNISYLVMRNFSSLPEIIGNDIDILIDEKSKHCLLKILKNIALESNSVLISYNKISYNQHYAAIVIKDKGKFACGILHLDIKYSVFVHPFDLEPASRVINRSEKRLFNNIYIPSEVEELYLLVLHNLFGSAYKKEVYYEVLHNLANKKDVYSKALANLSRWFGKKLSCDMLDLVLKKDFAGFK